MTDRYINCDVYLGEELIAKIGVYQIPCVGEYLWFGNSLPSPLPSAYIITEIAHHVRPWVEHLPADQSVVIYVEPVTNN